MDNLSRYLYSSASKKLYQNNAFTYSFNISKNTKVVICCRCSFDEKTNKYTEEDTVVSLFSFGKTTTFIRKYTGENKSSIIPVKGIIEASIAWDVITSRLLSNRYKSEHHLLQLDRTSLIGNEKTEGILFSQSPSASDIKKLYVGKDFQYMINRSIRYDQMCRQNETGLRGFMAASGVKNRVLQVFATPVFAVAYLPKLLHDYHQKKKDLKYAKKIETFNTSSLPTEVMPAKTVPTAKSPARIR